MKKSFWMRCWGARLLKRRGPSGEPDAMDTMYEDFFLLSKKSPVDAARLVQG